MKRSMLGGYCKENFTLNYKSSSRAATKVSDFLDHQNWI